MLNELITARNYIIHLKYKWILKPIFFKIDPEIIHDWMTVFLHFLGKYALTRKIAYFCFGYSNSMLEQNILGINFKNPVGLSAGFDKNAALIDIAPSLGFGFTEVGSITGEPCPGNPKPRLWRLPDQKSLVVYYGLKNEGCEATYKRLTSEKFEFPVGISVAKTNCAGTAGRAAGIADYVKAYRVMLPIGDYMTINIS